MDADGTFPTIFETYEKSLKALNLFSEPRLAKEEIKLKQIYRQMISGDFPWNLKYFQLGKTDQSACLNNLLFF